MDLALIRDHSAHAEKLAAGVQEFETYIRNNQEYIPNYGERYRQGETISTAFVESTINQVVRSREKIATQPEPDQSLVLHRLNLCLPTQPPPRIQAPDDAAPAVQPRLTM